MREQPAVHLAKLVIDVDVLVCRILFQLGEKFGVGELIPAGGGKGGGPLFLSSGDRP